MVFGRFQMDLSGFLQVFLHVLSGVLRGFFLGVLRVFFFWEAFWRFRVFLVVL